MEFNLEIVFVASTTEVKGIPREKCWEQRREARKTQSTNAAHRNRIGAVCGW